MKVVVFTCFRRTVRNLEHRQEVVVQLTSFKRREKIVIAVVVVVVIIVKARVKAMLSVIDSL